MKKLKNILYSLHRVLGTILSILFLVWFLSGFVMIYHSFPRVTNEQKHEHMDVLPQNTLSPDSATKTLPAATMFLKFSLKSYAGKPFYEGLSMEGLTRISADCTTMSERVGITPSYNQIENYASRWCKADIMQVDTLRELEQWIPFSYLKKDFPIYKFYFEDEEKHQLYISSQTGEALQFTNEKSRFWSWLGAIPHWIYFTSLRQNTQLWSDVIIWASGIGCIMCIVGLIMGVHSYIKQYRRKKKWQTPYKKFSYKWHHILGLVFGVFVFSFAFSGMMSLADVPQWMVKVHNPSIQEQMMFPNPVILGNYKLNEQKVLSTYSEEIKSIEWASYGQIPLYKIIVGDEQLTIDASGDSLKLLNLGEQEIRANLSLVHTEPISISLITEYDNYYTAKKNRLSLPVYKVDIADADNSTYYINPKNGNTQYFNTNSKVHRWTYQALHSYNIEFLTKYPVLWNIIMWVTMIGGTFVSLTGVWLGFRYIKRKIKHYKKEIGKLSQ